MPLDSGYPDERLVYMADKSDAKCIITSANQSHRLNQFTGKNLIMDEVLALPPTSFPRIVSQPDDVFILLFTSGTTGMPKGVMLTHSNLAYGIAAISQLCEITHEDKIAGYASFGFDASMMDYYLALTNGGTIYTVPEEIRMDIEELANFFLNNEITYAFITTQLGRQFAIQYPSLGKLRLLSVGGEALVSMPLPAYKLMNAYGPTECTIFTTTLYVDRDYTKIPIGLPMPGYEIYIVGEDGKAVPIGEEGELCIGGPGVGKGYIHDPERTAKVFVSNPFSEKWKVMYRTGDIARIGTEGENKGLIVFEGRRDHQVKIRGFRVELTEVESRIWEYPGVADVTVQALPAPSGGLRIVAYLVSKEGM
jgi:amino acid adenylation domain-containing protein